MTSDTLAGRLRRLKTLAEAVGDKSYTEKLTALLGELELRCPKKGLDVSPDLLSDFHHWLVDKPTSHH